MLNYKVSKTNLVFFSKVVLHKKRIQLPRFKFEQSSFPQRKPFFPTRYCVKTFSLNVDTIERPVQELPTITEKNINVGLPTAKRSLNLETETIERFVQKVPPISEKDLNVDVPTAKLFLLILWVKTKLKYQPGNVILTSELYKNYKEYVELRFTSRSVMSDNRFYKEIAPIMSMFYMTNAKIKTLAGRGYVGVSFKE